MSADWKQSYDLPPDIQLTARTSRVQREDPSNINKASVDATSVHLQRARYADDTSEKRVRIPEPSPRRRSSGSIRYLRSYRQSPHRSRFSLDRSIGAKTPVNSVPPSPRASISQALLEHLLQDADIDLNSYGLEELRDGFFDASFDRSLDPNHAELIDAVSTTLPRALRVDRPKSLGHSVFKHGQETIVSLRLIWTTESGIKCAKSFLGFFIAYIICLIPRASDWLGNYSYILTLSAIVNHAGRSVGSQIDGLILTIVGTAAGLGWGSLALFVSTSTGPARSGYGGALATFLVLLTASLAWLRCIFTRFYQAVICAGIALCYTCLADTSEVVGWEKIFDYAIPWILGQAISLGVCLLLFPDTGSRSLAVALHNSLNATLQSLEFPQPDVASIKRTLAWNFVNLSQAVRDFTLELTLSRFQPEDVRNLRNLIQGMLRGSLALRPYTTLFEGYQKQSSQELAESIVNIGNVAHDNFDVKRLPSSTQAMQLVTAVLARPTAALLESIKESVSGGDAILMDISGYRNKLSSDNKYLSALTGLLHHLRTRMTEFDEADLSLIDHPSLPPTYSDHPEVVDLFLFVHPVRQLADKVEAFLEKVVEIQGKKRGLRILPPSYPMRKSLFRANCQVRHDRGGLTAGSYFRTKRELEKTMRELQSTAYIPLPRHYSTANPHLSAATGIRTRSFDGYIQQDINEARRTVSETRTIRYRVWQLLHRLQGFEARFALKVTIVTTLLSIPAWLPQSNRWWNSSESWWAVVVVWLNMHPRVGGNLQDLTSRTLCVVIGSVWGGLAYAAGNGSPFVMAVFAAIFMIPMMYRYTQSSHPRSGLIGCISFTIISLTIYKHGGSPTAIYMAWTRGLAFLVGVVAAVVVNCILWPFIARHELRKSLAMMMLYAAVLYRGVVAKYVYFADGEEPSTHDLERSEMLEGRLREGFVRIRQLMELTRHEIRLRAPFDVLPYSALTDACERFFDHLVEIRQSSVYFQPYMLAGTASAKEMLISVRRDAVAAILMNLYILAGALRAGRPVPRYLPSAAAARKRLLNRMEQVEREQIAVPKGPKPGKSRRWADVYQYAYSSALTDIVEELQQLQVYTKAITGEVGFDIKEQKVR